MTCKECNSQVSCVHGLWTVQNAGVSFFHFLAGSFKNLYLGCVRFCTLKVVDDCIVVHSLVLCAMLR